MYLLHPIVILLTTTAERLAAGYYAAATWAWYASLSSDLSAQTQHPIIIVSAQRRPKTQRLSHHHPCPALHRCRPQPSISYAAGCCGAFPLLLAMRTFWTGQHKSPHADIDSICLRAPSCLSPKPYQNFQASMVLQWSCSPPYPSTIQTQMTSLIRCLCRIASSLSRLALWYTSPVPLWPGPGSATSQQTSLIALFRINDIVSFFH